MDGPEVIFWIVLLGAWFSAMAVLVWTACKMDEYLDENKGKD